jgi:hypothetical protein
MSMSPESWREAFESNKGQMAFLLERLGNGNAQLCRGMFFYLRKQVQLASPARVRLQVATGQRAITSHLGALGRMLSIKLQTETLICTPEAKRELNPGPTVLQARWRSWAGQPVTVWAVLLLQNISGCLLFIRTTYQTSQAIPTGTKKLPTWFERGPPGQAGPASSSAYQVGLEELHGLHVTACENYSKTS